MEISQWEELDMFLSKLTFQMNKTFKTWGKSLLLSSHANETKF